MTEIRPREILLVQNYPPDDWSTEVRLVRLSRVRIGGNGHRGDHAFFWLSSHHLLTDVHLDGRSVLLNSMSTVRFLCFARLTTAQSCKKLTLFLTADMIPWLDRVVVSLLVSVLTMMECA